MKTVIFDFDGTIADSVPLIYEVVNEVLVKYKYPKISKEQAENLRTKNSLKILKESGIPFWKLPFMFRFAFKVFDRRADELTPFTGIKNVFVSLKKENFQVGIISSNSSNIILNFFKKNGFPEIDFLYTSRSLRGKTKMIRNCLRKLNIQNSEVVYVGDEVRDIEACRKNKIKCISVTWGFNTKESLTNANPTFLVANTHDLMSKIKLALSFNEKNFKN